MKVRPSDKLEWVAVAKKCLGLETIFRSEAWLSIFSGKIIYFLIEQKDGQAKGGFYLFETKLKGLRTYANPPLTPHCGWFFRNEASNIIKQASNEKKALSAAIKYIDSNFGGNIIMAAFPPEIIDMQPIVWEKYKVSPKYTYRIDLNETIQSIRNSYDTDPRKSLERSTEEGLEVRVENDRNSILKLINTILDENEAAQNREVVRNAILNLPTENSFAVGVYNKNVLVATSFCIFDDTTCYYILGGYSRAQKSAPAGVAAIDFAMQEAQKRGAQTFDFEGSMIQGVAAFFRSFGGVQTTYYSFNKAAFWKEVLLKVRYRELF